MKTAAIVLARVGIVAAHGRVTPGLVSRHRRCTGIDLSIPQPGFFSSLLTLGPKGRRAYRAWPGLYPELYPPASENDVSGYKTADRPSTRFRPVNTARNDVVRRELTRPRGNC